MLDLIRAEFETFVWLMERKKHIWIIPFVFFFFCMFMRWLMLSNYEDYIHQQANTTFNPIVTIVYEKGFNRINKIAVFGGLVIFILLYKKAKKFL